MITIKGNLILEKDTTYEDSLKVEGCILGKDGERFNLTIKGNLNCLDLTCRNLTCWDLTCWDLTCEDLTCRDLNCGNFTCWNLTCGDLNFYAFAITYSSFECKTWKARRDNYFIKSLDGKIIGEEKK